MELENLKEAWAALDNRLKRNEELNESIILEVIRGKTGKIVNRFIMYEMFSVALLLLMVPFCIYCLNMRKFPVWNFFMIFMAVCCFIYTFWGVYKLHGLMKFDVAKNVGNNILSINKYNFQIKHEKKVLFYFLIPVIVIFGVIIYASAKATLSLWTFLICAFICGILISYCSYKKFDKGVESVTRSLDEIRELREE